MILRRSVFLLVVALISVTAAMAAESDWPMARCDEAQSGCTPQSLALPLSLSWQYNTTKLADNSSAPAVVGGTAYFSSGNRIYAVDATSGTLKWQYPAADTLKSTIRTSMTVWQDLVLFGASDGILYAVNASDGRTAWAFPTKGALRSSPVVSGGTVFIGSNDNAVYAIDARTGEQVWTGGFMTKDDIISSPAVAPGMVIFASMDANVYAANVGSGRLRWNYQLPLSPVRSAPVVSGNLVFIGAGRVIYALSTKNGQLRYAINLPTDVATPPAISGNDLYVICRNKKLYAFVAGMGGFKPKWEQSVDIGMTADIPPTIAGDLVFVGCNKGLTLAYSAVDGQLVWSYTAAPSITGTGNRKTDFTSIAAPIAVADKALFILTDDGSLRCFRNGSPDNTVPKVYNLTPASDVPMSGSPPITVSAILYDESSGVNPNSIELKIDGERVEYKYDITTLKLTYQTPITQPLRPLRDGRHSLQLLATDWKGNELDHTWSFVVDNTIPPKALPKSAKTTKPTGPRRQRPAPPQPPVQPTPPDTGPAPGTPGGPGGPPGMPPGGPPMPPPGEPGPPMPGGPQ